MVRRYRKFQRPLDAEQGNCVESKRWVGNMIGVDIVDHLDRFVPNRRAHHLSEFARSSLYNSYPNCICFDQ